mgnify:CR=1 FL=1
MIILTGKGTIDTAVSALRLGATDFIEKDFYLDEKLELGLEKLDRMLSVLRENAELREQVDSLDRENRFYRDEFGSRYQTVSASPAMQSVLQQAERIASIPRPVLVLGERGTGKELVAGAIHFGGIRKTRPFVKVNCAALSSTLLESELFGHEKGAFTGADEARPGRFEAADGGTLFQCIRLGSPPAVVWESRLPDLPFARLARRQPEPIAGREGWACPLALGGGSRGPEETQVLLFDGKGDLAGRFRTPASPTGRLELFAAGGFLVLRTGSDLYLLGKP